MLTLTTYSPEDIAVYRDVLAEDLRAFSLAAEVYADAALRARCPEFKRHLNSIAREMSMEARATLLLLQDGRKLIRAVS